MIQMRSVKIKEHKGGGKYSCPPVQEEDETQEHAKHGGGKDKLETSTVVDEERNIGDTSCNTCSCQIYCNRNDSVPSTTSTSNNNGDIVPEIRRSKRKSLWSRSQHSRRLKMIVPSATGGTQSDSTSGVLKTKRRECIICSHAVDTVVLDPVHTNEEEEVTLMYAQHERVPMKDFSAEVRANLDVGNFVHKATLLMDVLENSLESVIDLMLEELLSGSERVEAITKEAKCALFTHDSGKLAPPGVSFQYDPVENGAVYKQVGQEKRGMPVHVLAKTIQGTSITEGCGFDYDQSWVCALCSLPSVQKRYVAIARLKYAANLGRNSQETRFIILVIAPTREKGTKNALETARTFATLLADMDCRQTLLEVKTEEDFKNALNSFAKDLQYQQSQQSRTRGSSRPSVGPFDSLNVVSGWFGRGLRMDLKRRLPHYWSDFKDGVIGHRSLHKLVSTTLFLYFACILPSIAFGVLNDKNTQGEIDVKKVVFAQSISGIFFSIFGGQPLIVMLTTAPLALYIKIIYSISEDFDLPFTTMYTLVGVWNTFFLLMYSVFDTSKLMKWSTRSTEEIFALFICIAFCVDAFKALANNFQTNYHSTGCDDPAISSVLNYSQNLTYDYNDANNATNATMAAYQASPEYKCQRENSLLSMVLMFGTLWVGVTIYRFTKSPFLGASKREVVADYALPVAVLFMSFIGSYVFRDISLELFPYQPGALFKLTTFDDISIYAVLGSMGVGFCLSLLFFMDQNISSAMVNSSANKLRKGSAYHLDLFVVALLNLVLSLFCLPWVHAALPHSTLHVRALADITERVDQGHVYRIVVRVRETRLTTFFSHILIGLSMLMIPEPLQYIPTAVLYGLFLYMAYTALDGNQMFERIMLLVTEQSAYPPNHYVRRVPQRKMHLFTGTQLMQLVILCGLGFSPWPYLKMVFPVIILAFLPIRHKLIPYLIPTKYLDALDRSH